MAQALPARPNLEFLKKTAKDRVRASRAAGSSISLADVQRTLAREYGFPSWRRLKAFVLTKAARPVEPPAATTATPPAGAGAERPAKISEWKPIMDAAYAGDATCVRRLLDAGADPNVLSSTPFRHRPLHRAIEHKKTFPKHAGHDAVVAALLERGADPRRRATPMRYTGLQLAAIDEPRFVPLLRPHFEPLDIFHAAVAADLPRVQRLLSTDRGLATATDEIGMTALHYCASSSMFVTAGSESLIAIARELLAVGADPNAPFIYEDGSPLRPLFMSTGLHDHAALAVVLIEAGADPCDMESVFHSADEDHRESLAVFERLVPADRLAEECTKCLAVQVRWGRTRGAPWLLAHGADPNWIDPESGESALQTASKDDGKTKLVKLLLASGGDPLRKSKSGATACVLAQRTKSWKVLELLTEAFKKQVRAGKAGGAGRAGRAGKTRARKNATKR